jgi:hypothetical protein
MFKPSNAMPYHDHDLITTPHAIAAQMRLFQCAQFINYSFPKEKITKESKKGKTMMMKHPEVQNKLLFSNPC